MENSLLEKREGVVEGRQGAYYEYTLWTEYWLGEELVHRSADVTLTPLEELQSGVG
jgi:hypothetical protein